MRRFAALVGLVALLFLGLSAVLYLALEQLFAGPQRPGALLLVACAVPLVFFIVVSLLGGFAFRRFGRPLADIIAAADAVAAGDLSVRVRTGFRGELGRLATRFNRMIAELERAEEQRRNLTADVAHELRTPLHIIQGNLEGILDGVYQPTPEHLAATLEETRLLARLVDDLQTLSLAEAGQLPLHPVTLSVAGLLSDVVTGFANQAAEQGVALQVADPRDLGELELVADPDRLDQVLSNLVANALRHTPSGGRVTLSAAPLPGGELMPGGARLQVADTGAGIPPEDLPYIFDRFWRGDRSRVRSAGAGSGLGLAIAKQLVQAHGGQIHAESQPGQGTVFTIDLPGDTVS
jgi:two-component system OmpR family sensor kinase/two-component system sensor histidine kinase BaeS